MSDYEYINATVTLPMPGDDSETVDYNCQFDFNNHEGAEGITDGHPENRTEHIKPEIEVTRLRLEITDFVWTAAFHIFDFKAAGHDVPHFVPVEEQLEAAAKAYLEELRK